MKVRLTKKLIDSMDRPGKLYDDSAPGLFVHVQERTSTRTGERMLRKSFVQRITIHGRRVDLGLGSPKWGVTTIAEARDTAIANYRIARKGGDPRVDRNSSAPSFQDAAETVIALHAAGWRDKGRSAGIWRASLSNYAFPAFGSKPVSDVTTADVMRVLKPIWSTKRETAKRVRQRIGAVMQWAVAEGYRSDNPAGDAISAALPKNGGTRAHFRALPHADVKGALETIRASGAWPATKLCLEFIALTAVRSGEARLATWDEIDLDSAVWTIPAAHTKSGKTHRVPLSERAVAILQEAAPLSGGDGLIFPSQRGKPLSDSTLSKLMRELSIPAVPHGFRSSFRDWAGEHGVEREVAEACLAHVVGGVEGAYARSDLLERRRPVMAQWGAYGA